MILADKGGTKGWVDIHAHILPGVDDGASDWEETGEMLCKAHKQGITHIIATPHYVSGQDTKKTEGNDEKTERDGIFHIGKYDGKSGTGSTVL